MCWIKSYKWAYIHMWKSNPMRARFYARARAVHQCMCKHLRWDWDTIFVRLRALESTWLLPIPDGVDNGCLVRSRPENAKIHLHLKDIKSLTQSSQYLQIYLSLQITYTSLIPPYAGLISAVNVMPMCHLLKLLYVWNLKCTLLNIDW